MANNTPETVHRQKQYNEKNKDRNREMSIHYCQDNKGRFQKVG